MHRDEGVNGDRQSTAGRAVRSQSPVSMPTPVTSNCVILLIYPCLPLARNCPVLSHFLFTVKADVFRVSRKPLRVPPAFLAYLSPDTQPSPLPHRPCGSVLLQTCPQASATGPLHWLALLPGLLSTQTSACIRSFTVSGSLWECHFVRLALSESSLSYPRTATYSC